MSEKDTRLAIDGRLKMHERDREVARDRGEFARADRLTLRIDELTLLLLDISK